MCAADNAAEVVWGREQFIHFSSLLTVRQESAAPQMKAHEKKHRCSTRCVSLQEFRGVMSIANVVLRAAVSALGVAIAYQVDALLQPSCPVTAAEQCTCETQTRVGNLG